MKKITTLLILVIISLTAISQEKLDYFLPNDVTYDKNIRTPVQFFGQEIGEWHLSHDQLLAYMREIASISNRVIIQEYARTWENRPLIYLIFTSTENQKKLDELKDLHIKHADPNEDISNDGVPLVIKSGLRCAWKRIEWTQLIGINSVLFSSCARRKNRKTTYFIYYFGRSLFKSRWIYPAQHLVEYAPKRNNKRRQ